MPALKNTHSKIDTSEIQTDQKSYIRFNFRFFEGLFEDVENEFSGETENIFVRKVVIGEPVEIIYKITGAIDIRDYEVQAFTEAKEALTKFTNLPEIEE